MDLGDHILLQQDLPAGMGSRPWLVGTALHAPLHRVIRPAPPDAWRTDEERVGLVIVDLASPPRIHIAELPIDFRQRSTGAAGAKRDMEIAASDGRRLFFVIESPFSDSRGWGKDNYVVSFDLRTWWWSAWHGSAGAAGLVARELDAGLAPERSLQVLSLGELVLRCGPDGAPVVVTDPTPYHLEDHERDAEASAARSESYDEARPFQGLSTEASMGWYAARKRRAWDAFSLDGRAYALEDAAAFARRRFGLDAQFLGIWSLHRDPSAPDDRLYLVLGVGDGSTMHPKLLLLDTARAR